MHLKLLVSGAWWICCTGGVPKREIQKRTGCRSLEALRKYERTGEQQQQAVFNKYAFIAGGNALFILLRHCSSCMCSK